MCSRVSRASSTFSGERVWGRLDAEAVADLLHGEHVLRMALGVVDAAGDSTAVLLHVIVLEANSPLAEVGERGP